jgi:hypothetical protein
MQLDSIDSMPHCPPTIWTNVSERPHCGHALGLCELEPLVVGQRRHSARHEQQNNVKGQREHVSHCNTASSSRCGAAASSTTSSVCTDAVRLAARPRRAGSSSRTVGRASPSSPNSRYLAAAVATLYLFRVRVGPQVPGSQHELHVIRCIDRPDGDLHDRVIG